MDLQDTTAVLARTPLVLQALLGDLSPDQMHRTDQAFEPFDRSAMRTTATESPAALLGRFQTTRASSLTTLTAMQLTASDLKREGRHPELGVVTLGQLLASWVAHDLTHLAQIGEVLARGYTADVGPWRQYLPALDRVASAE